ncbi:MAG: T9SS type A sorting domain-containing protein [Ignavibacteria bacterium]
MTFTPNGQYLLTGGSSNNCYPFTCGQIKIWRVADSTLLRTISNLYNFGQTNDIAVYSDNSAFVSGHGSVYCAPKGGCSVDKAGQFKWNFPDSLPNISESSQDGITTSIEISPDESLIASATYYNFTGEIRIYDMSFNLIRTLAGHDGGTISLKFTPDGQYLVSGGHDGNVKIWNVSTGALVRTLFHGSYFDGGVDIDVDVSPGGDLIASAGQGYGMTIKIWNFSDGTILHTLHIDESEGHNKISFSPNGVYLGSGLTLYSSGIGYYAKLKFYRVSDGVLAEEYVDPTGSPNSGGIKSIAFSNAGNHYFAYSLSNRLRVATTTVSLVTATSVLPPVSSNVIHRAVLFQNTPNPFNPSTKIKYSIPPDISGNARISVYDGVGRKINTLVNEHLQAGEYEITFDGSQYASGIYYYKLEVNEFVEIRKMILIK